ncbi:hypothetical protein H8D30_01200 [bacterium]|nr:hypothetical protein [bacterium]
MGGSPQRYKRDFDRFGDVIYRSFPPAKINITLDLLNLREDRYHNLETFVLKIPSFSDSLTLDTEGLMGGDLGEDNLITRAHKSMEQTVGKELVAGWRLKKEIPVCGGFGGGSSDGWAALVLLNEAFSLGFSHHELVQIAIPLGCDLPLFSVDGPLWAKGKGTDVHPLSKRHSPLWVLLGVADSPISTEEAFRWWEDSGFEGGERTKEVIQWWETGDRRERCVHAGNDFERVVFPRRPELAEVIRGIRLTPVIASGMTGTGNGFFALYSKKENAEEGGQSLTDSQFLGVYPL